MNRYDADRAPERQAWLALDEASRIDLVVAYHRRRHPQTPRVRGHAAFHVVVETQLAMNEAVVVETLERLQAEGLSRHDAVHAIGSVLAAHVFDLLKDQPAASSTEANEAYFEELRRLSAESWHNTDWLDASS